MAFDQQMKIDMADQLRTAFVFCEFESLGQDRVNIKCLRAGTGMLWARDNRTGVVRGQPIKCVGLALPTLVIREVPEAERIKP